MPQKESKAVPEGNGPTPQDAGKMVNEGNYDKQCQKRGAKLLESSRRI